MMPINPRELQKQLRQLRRMGIKVEAVENVRRASIELGDKVLILEDPQVMVFEMGGQKVFYIIPTSIREESVAQQSAERVEAVAIKDEDVSFIAEYTGVPVDEARKALIEAGGDIAKAIDIIQQRRGSKPG